MNAGRLAPGMVMSAHFGMPAATMTVRTPATRAGAGPSLLREALVKSPLQAIAAGPL
jgi:hypothetical protein